MCVFIFTRAQSMTGLIPIRVVRIHVVVITTSVADMGSDPHAMISLLTVSCSVAFLLTTPATFVHMAT